MRLSALLPSSGPTGMRVGGLMGDARTKVGSQWSAWTSLTAIGLGTVAIPVSDVVVLAGRASACP